MLLLFLQSKSSAKDTDNVRVVVRCRPLNEKEISNGNQMAVKVRLTSVYKAEVYDTCVNATEQIS